MATADNLIRLYQALRCARACLESANALHADLGSPETEGEIEAIDERMRKLASAIAKKVGF